MELKLIQIMENNVVSGTLWLQIGVSQYNDLSLCQHHLTQTIYHTEQNS
jgi:hypothetical protein